MGLQRHTSIYLISSIIALSHAAYADDLTIPHTFTAGTPARAAEVNQNFTAVEASVDDNAADILTNAGNIANNTADVVTNTGAVANNVASTATNTAMISANNNAIVANAAAISSLETGSGVMVYSQGSIIGRFLTERGNAEASMVILSNNGYIFRTNPNLTSPNSYLGIDHPIYFSGLSCSGDAYISLNAAMWELTAGAVLRADAGSPSSAYYTARGSTNLPNVAYQSVANGSICNANSPGVTDLIPVFPNDPAITGVSNTPPSLPLTLGLP